MKNILIIIVFMSISVLAQKQGKPVFYTIDGKSYEGYFIRPSAKAPLVILIHDWDGLTEYEIKRAHMLAGLGYAVFAADLFGKGVRPKEIAERKKLTGALYNDREKMRYLLKGALASAKKNKGNVSNAIIMGYCFGGTAVLEFARSGAPLKGFVSFHGGLTLPEGQNYSMTKGKVLVFHGTADKSVTMEHFAQLASALESTGVKHEMITYGNAPHAFSVFGSDRYRENADKKSWKRFVTFLEDNLK